MWLLSPQSMPKSPEELNFYFHLILINKINIVNVAYPIGQCSSIGKVNFIICCVILKKHLREEKDIRIAFSTHFQGS